MANNDKHLTPFAVLTTVIALERPRQGIAGSRRFKAENKSESVSAVEKTRNANTGTLNAFICNGLQ